MSEVEISREFNFEAAHFIPNHKGACKNLHGHSYTGEVVIAGPLSEDMGMVMDYGDLKDIINDEIVDKYDHAMLNDHFSMPTAEIMVEAFYDGLYNILALNHPDVRLVEVSLKETRNSRAICRG